jgi:HD-GYP domain-containing protein (c-di-GMP phosphodiesterase class II)
MGQKFGLSNSECELLRIASTMHDIGKIGIEESILKKRGPLTPEEFDVMKTHVTIGYEILNKSELDIMNASALIALNHHEKWDGSGYPKGLKAYEIPLYARIMAVVDVFDAMTHRRCYKDAFSVKETLEYLVSNKGRHFDPVFVDLLVTNIDEIIEISSRGNCNE